MTAAEAMPAAHALPRWLTAPLIVLAGLQTALYVLILPILVTSFFSDDHWDTAPLMTAKLLVAPFLAGGALYFAARARLSWAVMLLAALNLAGWVTELSRLPRGLNLATLSNLGDAAELVLYPLVAVIAVVLALSNRFLAMAALLVGIPFLVLGFEAGALGVGAALYGR